jgi:hypothetical protein
MSLSETEICAKAMVLLGQNPISDIDDTTNPNAVKCKAAYYSERDSLIREFDWSFARARSELQQTTEPDFGYSYAFEIPSGCLAVRLVNDNLYDYEIEGNSILTDMDTCELVYSQRVEETGRFDALFVECLAVRVARSLAYSVLKKLNVMQAMDALFEKIKPTARRVDISQSKPAHTSADTDHAWLNVR